MEKCPHCRKGELKETGNISNNNMREFVCDDCGETSYHFLPFSDEIWQRYLAGNTAAKMHPNVVSA